MMASALPAVWRSIGGVVSQMKAMQQQVNVSASIHKVMSAILTEAAEVLEAKRKIKEDLAKGGHKVEAELEASNARMKLENRLSDLRHQVAKMLELLASETPPSEQEVLDVLSDLKVSRIRTMATAVLSLNRLNSIADKGIKAITKKSALGLPSLELRRKEPKANGGDMSSEGPLGGLNSPSLTSPDVLEQIQARALHYSRSFSAIASMRASHHQANLPRQPMGIPSLPGQRDMKSKRKAQAEEVPLEVQEQVLARALQYSGSFSAIALQHASRQASFLRQAAGPSADRKAQAPIGIPSLPKKRMKSRQRAQAQVDEATWKASCSVLA